MKRITTDLKGGLYDSCAYESEGGAPEQLAQCIAAKLEYSYEQKIFIRRSWLFVLFGAVVFFMQTGFAMLCGGAVRKKNVQNTMLKNWLDACGAAVAWFTVGFAFAFGGQDETDAITFVGTTNFFGSGNFDPAYWFFEYSFSTTCVTIIAGTLAERCQMLAYLIYSVYMTGFVYPVVAHSMWSRNGLLSPFSKEPYRGVGAIDFSGSSVIHMTAGSSALIATYILGARKGRFHDISGRILPQPRTIRGHSISLQLLGTMALWFSWIGFNGGSALTLDVEYGGKVASLAAVNTALSGASGCLVALVVPLLLSPDKKEKYAYDLVKTCNGTLGALVAITAPCAVVESWAALVIGAVAGVNYLVCSWVLVRVRLDDAVDAIPVHLANGFWGMVAVGLFASPERKEAAYGTDLHSGWFYEIARGTNDATLLGNELLAACLIVVWAFLTMGPFFTILNMMGWLRTDSLEELIGLDLAYMGNRRAIMEMAEDDFSDYHPEIISHIDVHEKERSQANQSDKKAESEKWSFE